MKDIVWGVYTQYYPEYKYDETLDSLWTDQSAAIKAAYQIVLSGTYDRLNIGPLRLNRVDKYDVVEDSVAIYNRDDYDEIDEEGLERIANSHNLEIIKSEDTDDYLYVQKPYRSTVGLIIAAPIGHVTFDHNQKNGPTKQCQVLNPRVIASYKGED